eukprot:123041_1
MPLSEQLLLEKSDTSSEESNRSDSPSISDGSDDSRDRVENVPLARLEDEIDSRAVALIQKNPVQFRIQINSNVDVPLSVSLKFVSPVPSFDNLVSRESVYGERSSGSANTFDGRSHL